MAINSIEVTIGAVRRQLAAMGATAFEVGLYRPEIEGATGPEMLPRTWDRETLLKSVSLDAAPKPFRAERLHSSAG
jgi:hypothetical protein